MKQTITRTEYLQLVGLLTLSREGKRNMERVGEAMVRVFDAQGVDRSTIEDRIYDAWWGGDDFDVDPLLLALKVTVVDDPDGSTEQSVAIGREVVIELVQAVEGLKEFAFRLPEDVAEPVLAAQQKVLEAIR